MSDSMFMDEAENQMKVTPGKRSEDRLQSKSARWKNVREKRHDKKRRHPCDVSAGRDAPHKHTGPEEEMTRRHSCTESEGETREKQLKKMKRERERKKKRTERKKKQKELKKKKDWESKRRRKRKRMKRATAKKKGEVNERINVGKCDASKSQQCASLQQMMQHWQSHKEKEDTLPAHWPHMSAFSGLRAHVEAESGARMLQELVLQKAEVTTGRRRCGRYGSPAGSDCDDVTKDTRVTVREGRLNMMDKHRAPAPQSSACLQARLPGNQTVSISALAQEDPMTVQLVALTPEDVVSDSVLEVRAPGLHGEEHSVTDPRLGPAKVGVTIPCATCLNLDCGGHAGHIDLHEYVVHPTMVLRCVQTLRKICFYCLGSAQVCERNLEKARNVKAFQRAKPTISQQWMERGMQDPLDLPDKALCARKQPRYRVVVKDGVKVVELITRDEKTGVEVAPNTIRAIFEHVPEETWHALGMRNPTNEVFIRYLRVCPPAVRPASDKDGSLQPSPLTVRYNDVVKARDQLDHVLHEIDNLMDAQDKAVRMGVEEFLEECVDKLTYPGQSSEATAIKTTVLPEDTAKEDDSEKTDVDAAPHDVNFHSDDEGRGEEGEEKEYLNSVTEKQHDSEGTPQHGDDEWVLADEDDENKVLLQQQQQQQQQQEHTKVKDEEEMEVECEANSEDEDPKEVLRKKLLGDKIQKVREEVSRLHQVTKKRRLCLAAAVAGVISELVATVPGKAGVLRHHLLGKRINMCGRAVFTGDNSLPLGVVGVPRAITAKLFQYVHVHEANLHENQKLADRFPEYPCVVRVVRGDRAYELTERMQLQVGDVVQRHLIDGDQVVVNRQPTLAKANMVAHTVLVTDTNTISLNIAMTDNYAADCDGDEMNLFVPGVASHCTRLLDARHNIVFPKNGKVAQKIKQDALRGAFSVSLKNTFFTQEEFLALLPQGIRAPQPALMKPARLWTGLQLLSAAFPDTLTVDEAGRQVTLDQLVVRHGQMLSGVFDKGNQDRILSCCKMFFDSRIVMDTVKNLQYVAEKYVDEHGGVGFTFLPEDWSCSEDTLASLRKEMRKILRRARHIRCPTRRNAKLRQLLADMATRLVDALPQESNVGAMLKAGSKKRPQKLAQVCLAVGQHNQDDQMPPKHLDGRRLLPFFKRGDRRPQAEGFVDEPLFGVGSTVADALSGMVARSSSYKKHCATGESGYFQRKLGKLMEDVTVRHDGTVRDANDQIVQLLYGDDGMLPERCVPVSLSTEPLPQKVLWFYYTLCTAPECTTEERQLLMEEVRHLHEDRTQLRNQAAGEEVAVTLPFHLPHLLAHVASNVGTAEPPPSVTLIVSSLRDLFAQFDASVEKPQDKEEEKRRCQLYQKAVKTRRLHAAAASRLGRPLVSAPTQLHDGKFPKVNTNRELDCCERDLRQMSLLGDPLLTLKRYVRQHVNTYSVLRGGYSANQLRALLQAMLTLYQQSRPAAGESVGALAAQALAEPLMQMTLNACHRAAVASDGEAIPRLTELINAQAEDLQVQAALGGILQARRYLVREVTSVYTLAGEDVDVRHVRLLADCMLRDGELRGFTREDVPHHTNFLKAAAFEQPLSVLQHAGRLGRLGGLRGVSENLIVDKTVGVGPETCDLLTWVAPRHAAGHTDTDLETD